jgi:hypothetical protein
MSDSLHPILIDAKREYQVRLTDLMTPFLLQYINGTYACAKEEVGSRNALIEFQRLLHAVPQWNSGIIRERTEAIEKKYSFFSNLVAAVFVATIKVLSSIRISSQRPNIKLKLPANDAFVHKVYVCVARNFYENVTVMRDGDLAAKKRMICNGIETAVRDMLPLGEVLTAYLSTAVDDNQVNPVLSPVQSDDEDAVSSIDSSSSDDDDTESKIVPLDDSNNVDFPTPTSAPQFAPAPPAPPSFEVPEHQPYGLAPVQQTHQPFPSVEYQMHPHHAQPPQPPSQQAFHSQQTYAPQAPHVDQGLAKPPLFPDADDDDRHFR